MDPKEHRRKSKRYPIKWKAAVVFDKSVGRPVLHTETHDLSSGGAAIRSDYADLTGSYITLLLAQPGVQTGETSKMFRVRARVVSCVQTPPTPGFRHGLSFVRGESDGLGEFEEVLRGADDHRSAAAGPAAKPAAAADSGRLAQLKRLAQQKLTEERRPDPKEVADQRVSEALKRIHAYLKDLCEQLDVVKPALGNKGYLIAGVPEFTGLAWAGGRVDLRTREKGHAAKLIEQVSLHFSVSSGKQLRIMRDFPASEKLKQHLVDYKIAFNTGEQRNAKGSLERVTFEFRCEVKASLHVEADFDACKLRLKTRNVERFGIAEHLIDPEAVTQGALEELAGYILAESSRIGSLLRNA